MIILSIISTFIPGREDDAPSLMKGFEFYLHLNPDGNEVTAANDTQITDI
jgi:hypothetical protein